MTDQKPKKKSLFYAILFMAVVTAIFTAALSFLNQSTIEAIEKNRENDLRRKILYVFDILPAEADDPEIEKLFEERIKVESGEGDKRIYSMQENGTASAYAVPFDGPGLWGSINGYVGITADLKNLTGLEFIMQSETPGLGGRIGEEPYKEQFRGVDVTNRMGDEIVINRPAPGGNIDAIAGATQTSNYVKNMLNQDLIEFMDQRGGN
ncbi:MAG: FMN-binding protein [Tissierellia bacterium]|nr:FMN-binding protein [Tissierellia bacterium]